MKTTGYGSMDRWWELRRREFLKLSAIASAGLVFGRPAAGEENAAAGKPRTNIDEVKDLPRTATSLPGPHPGRVVTVHDPAVGSGAEPDAVVVAAMLTRGLEALTVVVAAASSLRGPNTCSHARTACSCTAAASPSRGVVGWSGSGRSRSWSWGRSCPAIGDSRASGAGSKPDWIGHATGALERVQAEQDSEAEHR